MSARDLAFGVLRRVEEGGAYASRALDAALSAAGALDPREAGLATELTYGTLRRALSLDAALAPALAPAARPSSTPPRGWRSGSAPTSSWCSSTPAHAAVGETVSLARGVDHGRAAGYVNAVLRALARAPHFPRRRRCSTRSRRPRGGRRGAAPLAGRGVGGLARPRGGAGAGPRHEHARPRSASAPAAARGAARASPRGRDRPPGPPRARRRASCSQGASVADLARAAGGLPFQVQDEASQLAVLLAAGELRGRRARVLDACAAPGGKAFQLAELLGPGLGGRGGGAPPAQGRRAGARGGAARARGRAGGLRRRQPGSCRGSPRGASTRCSSTRPAPGSGPSAATPSSSCDEAPPTSRASPALQLAIARRMARYARPGAPVTYSVCSLSRAEGPEVSAALVGEGGRLLPPPPGFPADVLDASGRPPHAPAPPRLRRLLRRAAGILALAPGPPGPSGSEARVRVRVRAPGLPQLGPRLDRDRPLDSSHASPRPHRSLHPLGRLRPPRRGGARRWRPPGRTWSTST